MAARILISGDNIDDIYLDGKPVDPDGKLGLLYMGAEYAGRSIQCLKCGAIKVDDGETDCEGPWAIFEFKKIVDAEDNTLYEPGGG